MPIVARRFNSLAEKIWELHYSILRTRTLILLLPLTLIYFELFAAPFEDRELTRRFGRAYVGYRHTFQNGCPS